MKKLILYVVGLFLITAMTVGIVYAWTAKPSDVGNPVPSPTNADIVKYHVIGTSMSPTINDGDWLLVNTADHTIEPGDIVIMRLPKDPTTVYCRRVVAVGGDKVQMKYYSNVKMTTIIDTDQSQTTFPQGVTPAGNAYGEYDTTVDPGNFYVVGDNTQPGASYDSDEWGELPQSDIVGVVESRVSPNPTKF